LLFIIKKTIPFNTSILIILACRELGGSVFLDHCKNSEFGDDGHEIKLIKLIGLFFFKVMCHSISKKKTEHGMISKIGMRQKLNKIILFSNV
jgi:hypothetical protein